MYQLLLLTLVCVGAFAEEKGFSHLNDKYDGELKKLLVDASGAIEMDHFVYSERVKVLRDLIREECKDESLNRRKREILSEVKKTKLQVEKVLYERMIRMLIECRSEKGETTSQPPTTSQLPTTNTWKTTSPPPTTRAPPPAACQSATNLTESWRANTLGSKILPINNNYNCETTSLRNIWFRFTGDAGNMMLDKCPPENSCGTHAGMWTNDSMPTNVGVIQSFTAYASAYNNCKLRTQSMQVMRCSNDVPNDFIYKIPSGANNAGCTLGFCGMSKLN